MHLRILNIQRLVCFRLLCALFFLSSFLLLLTLVFLVWALCRCSLCSVMVLCCRLRVSAAITDVTATKTMNAQEARELNALPAHLVKLGLAEEYEGVPHSYVDVSKILPTKNQVHLM